MHVDGQAPELDGHPRTILRRRRQGIWHRPALACELRWGPWRPRRGLRV